LRERGKLEPTDKCVTVNSLRLHYLEWGNEEAQPMVLVHGYGAHAHQWDAFSRAMCSEYHVLALDLRGHGDSEWSREGYSETIFARDLAAFVGVLGLRAMVLAGLSLGGLVAMCYMAEHGDRVSRLVIVDIGPEIAPVAYQNVKQSLATTPDEFNSLEEAFQFARSRDDTSSDEDVHGSLRHDLRQLPGGRWGWKYDRLLRRPGLDAWPGMPDLWPVLSNIRCPTLVVRGENSDILSPRVARRMAETLPHGRLVTVPGAGHNVPRDRPGAFLRVVRTFLET